MLLGLSRKLFTCCHKEIRRIDIEWEENEIPWYDQLVEMAKYVNKDIQEIIKEMIKEYRK